VDFAIRSRSAQSGGNLDARPKAPGADRPPLLLRDGLPIALLAAGEVPFLETLEVADEWEAHKALLRANPAPIDVKPL
jgi:ATP-dependent helicase Lhr and Lhr-like helicase